MTVDAPVNHLVERAATLLREGAGLGRSSAAGVPSAGIQPAPAPAAPAVARTAAPAAAPRAVPLDPERLARRGLAATLLDRAVPEPESPSAHPPIALSALQRAGLADAAGRRTRVTEELTIAAGNLLRALRAAQRQSGGGAPAGGVAPGRGALPNLVMITSAKPDEGKSFSALNLAAALARGGAQVLLVDADPKLGSLTTELGIDDVPGLLELAGDPALRPEAVPVPTAVSDLSVVPLGARAAARGDRAIASQLVLGVERLARRFGGHVLVLDAPPCLATSEPAALCVIAGVIAVVVEAERTQRDDLEHALEMLRPCPHVMLLLNKMRGAAGTAFGEYDYYGA